MGLEKPRENPAMVSGVFTPTEAKRVSIPNIAGRDYVMISCGAAVAAFDTYDTILLIHIRDNYRIGYYNGADGISIGNTDAITIDDSGNIDITGTAANFRVGTLYRYEAF